jgi:putative transposase
MGLVAIYQRPNTSKAAPEHTKYPYLLGGLTIDRVIPTAGEGFQ